MQSTHLTSEQAAQEVANTLRAVVTNPAVLTEDPDFLVNEGHRDARALELAARALLDGGDAYAQDQRSDAIDFGMLVYKSTQRASGIGLSPTPNSAGIPVPAIAASGGCAEDIQAAIDAAKPGDEVVACPGTHDTFTVDKHFLTVRSQQGPLATVIDGGDGPAITVTAAGVTIDGFQVKGGDTGILVGDPDAPLEARSSGDLAKTTLRDNLLRDNGQGIVLWRTTGTIIAENTIRGTQGSAILVAAQGSGGLTDGAEREALGTLVVANNFIANRGLAIENQATLPVIAAANYYGSAAGPTMEVAPAGTCVGASAPLGDARCHNALGPGVVSLGFSPVAIE